MGNTFAVPRAATEDEIKNIITGFAHAAEFLDRAGYDGIELHAAHGYLLSQFLSQATNLRRDKYGGSPTNRMRLILEIRAAITEKVRPGFIVGSKLTVSSLSQTGLFVTRPGNCVVRVRSTNSTLWNYLEGNIRTWTRMILQSMSYRRNTRL